jgi:hypothetical protein
MSCSSAGIAANEGRDGHLLRGVQGDRVPTKTALCSGKTEVKERRPLIAGFRLSRAGQSPACSAGMTGWLGPPKTLEQMQAGIARKTRRHHARNR